jgi:type I restriction enzyme, S subunit
MNKVTLGTVAKVLNGYAFKSKEYVDDGIRIIRITNVQKGRIQDDNPKFIETHRSAEFAPFMLADGDILISLTGNVGRVGVIEQSMLPAALNQRVGALQIESQAVDQKYLFHVLNSDNFEQDAIKNSKGIAQLNLSSKWIENFEFPLPPLPEQKRIAAILDAADALRAKRRESLAQLDALLQSTFLEMFGDPVANPKGWEVRVIGDLLSANYGTSKKANSEHGAYPILRMNNITYQGEWNFSSLKYIDLDEKELPKHLVHKGQLLFNRTNSKELVGKTAVFRKETPMAFAGYLVRGIVNHLADPEYIGAFMNTAQIKIFLQNKCKSIVGMANINAKEFQAIPIPKPPLHLQRRFATIVESVEQQKALQRAHLTELDALFASLQHRAFNGELSPSHPANVSVAKSDYNKKPDTTDPVEKSANARPIEEYYTNEIMAALRQVFRGKTRLNREELLKGLSLELGYARLGPKARTILSGHVVAAQRRHILTSEGDTLCMECTSIVDYTRDELVETVISVTNMNCIYTREELIYAVSDHLGFRRVTDATRDTMKSTINAALRRNIVEHYDNESVKRIG